MLSSFNADCIKTCAKDTLEVTLSGEKVVLKKGEHYEVLY